MDHFSFRDHRLGRQKGSNRRDGIHDGAAGNLGRIDNTRLEEVLDLDVRRIHAKPDVAVVIVAGGVKPLNLDAPVKYLTAEEGGVSHFRYGRDNALLTWMHTRLMIGFVLRLPGLLWRRLMRRPPFQA